MEGVGPSVLLLASMISLLVTSLLLCARSYRRSVHLSSTLRRLIKPVVLDQAFIVDGKLFPLTLSPTDANAGAAARISLARANSQEILALVRTHGAVLLRGWGKCSASHFSELMATLELPVTAMACSAGPRFAVAANVFTANEAPPAERIPFHHEMAQCNSPPSVSPTHHPPLTTHRPLPATQRPSGGGLLLRNRRPIWGRDAPPAFAPRRSLPARAPPHRCMASQGGGYQVYAARRPNQPQSRPPPPPHA